MKQLNGYIKVNIRQGQAYCHIYPPKPGGKHMRFGEIEEFLRKNGFTQYEKSELRAIYESNEEGTYDLGFYSGPEFGESINVKVSLDKMKVTATFLPGSTKGPKMTVRDIMESLKSKNVVIGIDQDMILQHINDPCYATEYIFAQGIPPRLGRDGKVEYLFNTNPNLKPKHNEDGSVDYRNLNVISSVYEGDVLAKLIPADRGEPGKDVTGKEIPVRPVKEAHFVYGKDIHVSEDGMSLISDVTGHVNLSKNKVMVSAVYDVPYDVDNSTGNIDFDGNVHIKGSVRTGFSIYARGDVIIDGVVEGSLIQADGQIIVIQGVHGMHKGILDAGGNIICSFIENAKVFSGGYVESGSIIYSEVNASEDVKVLDKKGFIVGGVIRAGGKVESMTIGSQMEALTKIEVGIAPEKKERFTQLKRSMDAMVKKINKLSPIIKTYHDFLESGKSLDQKNIDYLRKLVLELEQTKSMLAESRNEYNSLNLEMVNSQHSKVIVRNEIFAGAEITISDLTIINRTKRSNCQFEKRNGEILVSNNI